MEAEERKVRLVFIEETAKLGGAQINELYLQKYLDRKKFETLVVCPSKGPLTEELEKLQCQVRILSRLPFFSTSVRIGGKLFFNPFACGWNIAAMVPLVFSLAWTIQKFKADLVLTNGMLAHSYGAVAAKLAGKPCVWLLADIIRPDLAFGAVKAFFQFLAGLLPAKIVCVSEAVKNQMCSGRLSLKSVVIHNGVDLEKFDPSKAAPVLPREFQIPQSSKIVGIMSRLTPWKGHSDFIEAAKIVSAKIPNVYFMIVGGSIFENEDYPNELKRKVQAWGLEKRIIFTGFRKDIPECLASMDLCVVPSVLPEPFGLIAVEAMAMAKPVIGTNHGGMSEIILEGKTGRLVPPGNATALAEAMIGLMKDEKQAEGLGVEGRLRAQKEFNIEKFIKKHEALFFEITQKHL